MTELIFHIGGGKTGSSSIQATLKANQQALLSEGISYWGLMLEEAPIKRFGWQHPGGTNTYYSEANSSKELAELIAECLVHCERGGIGKAVWSNEWFLGSAYEFERNKPTLEAIRSLIGNGHKITVVAYIRDHISWAISAYFQWGIKHKTYSGDLMDFETYTSKRPPNFFAPLKAWKDASDGNLRLFNFHSAGNVAAHFLEYISNAPQSGIEYVMDNQSPDKRENFLRAAFNQILSKGQQYEPARFNTAFQDIFELCDDRDLVGWYNQLIPKKDNIDSLKVAVNEDLKSVNLMLAECGEPDLKWSNQSKLLEIEPRDMEPLISLITQVLIALAERNQSLEHQLLALRKSLRNSPIRTV